MVKVKREAIIIHRGEVNFPKNIPPPTIKHGRVHAEMPLINGVRLFTIKYKKDADAKRKNGTIDNAKQTILLPR